MESRPHLPAFLEGHAARALTRMVFDGRRLTAEIEMRCPPEGLHTTSIAVDRAKKPPASGPLIVTTPLGPCASDCTFGPRNLKRTTPGRRLRHFVGDDDEARSFPNLFSFLEAGYVTVTDRHPATIKDIGPDHIRAHLVTGKQVARRLAKRKSAYAVVDFVNWGPRANMSKAHFHSQRGLRLPSMGCLSLLEQHAWDGLAAVWGQNPFDLYIAALRELKLVIAEDLDVVVAAPFAPMYPDQVDVIPKLPAPHYLDVSDKVLEATSCAIARSLTLLAELRGVTDFNLVTHSAPFTYRANWFRMHWHILPRNSRGDAGAEVGEHIYVVDVFPETTARQLRGNWGPINRATT